MLTRRNGEKYITTHPVTGNEYTLLKQKTGASTDSTKNVPKKKKTVMSPWCRSGVRRPNTELKAFCVPAKTAAPDCAPLPKSCTDCGCKGSMACCIASDKTAADRARAEPSLPAFNETLCEMITVHNYILFRLKQCLIGHRTG